VELSQNREMIRAQTRNEISQQLSNRLLSVATNRQLASVMRRSRDGEKLTDDEFTQIYVYHVANLRDWENIHYQYRHGTFDQQEFDAEKTAWRSLIEDNKIFQGVFCNARLNDLADFVAALESVLHEDYCARPQRD